MIAATSSVVGKPLETTQLIRFFGEIAILGILLLGIGVLLHGFSVLKIATFVSNAIQIIAPMLAVIREIVLLGFEYLAAARAQSVSPSSSARVTEDIPALGESWLHLPTDLVIPQTPFSTQTSSRPFLFPANTNLPLSTTLIFSRLNSHAKCSFETTRLGTVPKLSPTCESSQTIAERRQAHRIALELPHLAKEQEKGSGSKVVDRILGIENRAPPNTPEATNNPWGVPDSWLDEHTSEEEGAVNREARNPDKLMRGSLKGVCVSEDFELFFDM